MSGVKGQDRVIIDGAHGEGGGQILRAALSLSAITGRPLRIERIRSARRIPVLAAQHLTALRAAAAICSAQLSGDTLGSTCVEFAPEGPVVAGNYVFDVSLAREGGSAGAVTLVLQTILLPLAFAAGDSRVELHGGTHMAWSPPFDYVRDVWLPALARISIEASVELAAWGWYPVGKGEMRAHIRGLGARSATLRVLELEERGPLLRILGGRSRPIYRHIFRSVWLTAHDPCWQSSASICASSHCVCAPPALAPVYFSLPSTQT